LGGSRHEDVDSYSTYPGGQHHRRYPPTSWTPLEQDLTCEKIESKSELGRFVRRGKGRRCSLSGRAWDRRCSGRGGAGEGADDAEGRRSRAAGSRSDGGAVGTDAAAPSPPTAAASPLLGFLHGSAPRPV
jgi:hypothetical protein